MIIDTIEQLKEHIATITASDINIFKPYLKTAEKWLFREILGAELQPYVVADEPELFDLAASVISHKAYLEAIPFLDLIQTESGFAVTRNDNLAPASPERVKALTASTAAKLDEAVEDLLEWLELQNDTDIEIIWKTSKSYTLINDNFVRSIRQFREYGEWAGSRVDWIRFRPKLVSARKLKIDPVISAAQSDAIIEALRDDDVTPAMVAVLDDLRFALAAFAAGDEASGLSYISRVRSYMIAHVDDFPQFKASDIYTKYVASLEVRDTSGDPFMVCGV